MADHQGPLAGVRVIDFGQLTAGANASAMLADLGAEVIKVESGDRMDIFRAWKPDGSDGWWNRSPQFHFTNRNKFGVSINLKHPDGRKLLQDLLCKSDLVVENFRRGVLESLGLGYTQISPLNPKIVYAAISSQGDVGPNRLHRTLGSTLDAIGGLAAITGYEDGSPLISGRDFNYPDQIVSLAAVGFIVAALRDARRTGQGASVDVSQRELASFLVGEHITAASADPRYDPRPQGNAEPGLVLQECFKGADGRWTAITLRNDSDLRRIETIVGPGPDLEARLAGWFGARNGREATRLLLAEGLSASEVNGGSDLLEARALWGRSLEFTDDGQLVKGVPYVFEDLPFRVERSAPDLGQHTRDILENILGLEAAEIERLRVAGVIDNPPEFAR